QWAAPEIHRMHTCPTTVALVSLMLPSQHHARILLIGKCFRPAAHAAFRRIQRQTLPTQLREDPYFQSNTATTHGIEINYNAIKAQLCNNTIDSNPGYGIVVGASNVSSTVIKNNLISSNVKGAINVSGTETILESNLVH